MREQIDHAAVPGIVPIAIFRRAAGWLTNLLVYLRYPRALRHYWAELHRLPNVAFPTTYNEKMFWRRVFDHNPAFVAFSDKLAAKSLFAGLSGIDTPETLWIGEDPDLYPDELLRDDVVAKMTAGAGRNWFFAEHGTDADAFRSAFRRWLRHKPSPSLGEWSYGKIPPTLFAERLVKPRGDRLEELKVHLFVGEVFYTVVYVGEKRPGTQSAIFDEAGQRLAVTTSLVERLPGAALPPSYRLPPGYALAMAAARSVAKGTDYVRVDFMCADRRVFAGEVTIYPTAGLMTNSDPAVMAEMAERWDLRRSWFASTPQHGWRGVYRRLLLAELDIDRRRTAAAAAPREAERRTPADEGRGAAATP